MKSHVRNLLKLGQRLILFVVLVTQIPVLAEDEVVIESAASYSEVYKNRRTEAGAFFSITQETLSFPNYISTLDNSLFEDRYGSLALLGIQVQRKLNWSPISVAYGVGYSTGSAAGSGQATMTITKLELNARATLDGWSDEPRYAPFVFAEAWQMDVSEKDPTTSFSGKIEGFGFHYGAGISLQLNRLDFSSARDSYTEWGIENTYLDVYMSMNTAPADAAAPDVSTDIALGLGLTLEF